MQHRVSVARTSTVLALGFLIALFTVAADAANIAAGRFHGLWVKDDGSLWAWGFNAAGQVGDGTFLDRSFPVPSPGLSGVKAAAGGYFHSLALRTDGTVLAWGANNEGEIGDGTRNWRALPVPVSGLSGVSAIAAGNYHSLALKADGTVWAWGDNFYGQIGDGTVTGRIAPVRVPGLTGITAIAAGGSHSVALRADGTVWAWGDNEVGEIGDGTNIQRNSPVQVAGLTGVTAISTVYSHTLALKSDQTVWAWGDNFAGQLGDGTTTDRNVVVRVAGLTGVVQVVAGGFSSYARRPDGTVVAWGRNFYGQLGDGTTLQRTSPVAMTGITGATVVVAGASHAAILRSDGSISSVGQNVIGQLGDASIVQAPAPVRLNALSLIARVAAGRTHSLALRTNGTVVGWGENALGQLGDGTSIAQGTPVDAAGLTAMSAIAAGDDFSLALRSDGTVWSWGDNSYGQLGNSTKVSRTAPGLVPGLTGVVAIATGWHFCLAVKADGTLWAWGENTYGQLGDGTTTERTAPTRVTAVNGPVAIAAGGYHAMVLRADGIVTTWGRNDFGQLGDGTNVNRSTPAIATGLAGATAIAAGVWHSVAAKSGGTVWTWGYNGTGALGTGNYAHSNVPVQATGVTGAVSVSAGGAQSFAVAANGAVTAWGGGGTVGDGTDRDALYPATLNFIGPVDRIAAGYDSTLALTRAGVVMGWGSNYSQKLGILFPVQSTVPVRLKDPLAPFAGSDLAVEFFNPTIRNGAGTPGIGHYFITAAGVEAISIDNGGSGPGWQRTGRTFRAWNDANKAPPGAVPVYRFYAREPNSHFYTASEAERQSLRSANPTNNFNLGWAEEGIAFYTVLPQQTASGPVCPAGYYPIYRSYNNRFSPNPALNDGNHRLTPSYIDWQRSIYFLGYADEKIAFCAPATADATADLHAWYIYPGTSVVSGGPTAAIFVFANNGPGSANGGRVHMALPAEVTNWQLQCYYTPGTECPTAADLVELRSGLVIGTWPAGGVIVVTAVGNAPAAGVGGTALKFAAATTTGSGTPDANRVNNAPPTARTVVNAPQVCGYVLNPNALSLGPSTQGGQVAVLAGAGCTWSVQNSVPWLTASVTGGAGNGIVTLTPQANPSSASRSGTVIIAGQPVVITQAGVPCSYVVSPPSFAFGANAQTIQATVSAAAGCAWNAQSSVPWLAVAPAVGSGSGTLTLTLAANTVTASRTGAFTVGGQSVPVAQAGTVEVASVPAPQPNACATLRLQRDGDQMSAAGLSGESAVAVLADGVCGWVAQSSAGWLTVTSGGRGAGNGTIKYFVQPNTDPDFRIGTITAAGKAFTVTQQGSDVPTNNSGNDGGGDGSGGGSGSSGGGDSGGSSG
ncbi:MAG: BACON domain-containing carbohydrate-binding protein [Betaproteobacteria bacterium]